MKKFDAIIIGLGAYGSSLSLALAKEGLSVLGIDMYDPPHSYGSSHGDSRIARLANGEGDTYTQLAIRSRVILRQIQRKYKTRLMYRSGGLIISSEDVTEINHVPNVYRNTIKMAKKYAINHQILSANQIKKRYGIFNLRGNEEGYYERDSAIYFPEQCIKYNLLYAKELGSVHKVKEKVLKITENRDGVIVVTNKDRYAGNKVYLTAGAWNNSFLKKERLLNKYIKIYQQTLFWFELGTNFYKKYNVGRLPFFIWELPGRHKGVYGFPLIQNGSGIKIATEQYAKHINISRKLKRHNIDSKKFYDNYIKPNFFGITPRLIKTVNCMYSVTPDNKFLVRDVGKYKKITLVSCCSGHGFKHSYAITEAIAQIHLSNKSDIDISSFR